MTARSVGESSTIMIVLIVISIHSSCGLGLLRVMRTVLRKLCAHGLEQVLLGERLGEVVAGAGHVAPGAVEHAVLRRQHDHGSRVMLSRSLDQRAGLVSVEARH